MCIAKVFTYSAVMLKAQTSVYFIWTLLGVSILRFKV